MSKRAPKLNKNAQILVDRAMKTRVKQGAGRLCSNDNKYCFLGFACKVYQELKGDLEVVRGNFRVYFDGDGCVLPEKVRKFFGFRSNSGEFVNGSIMGLNDYNRLTFRQIAQIIKKKPKGLFARGR